jgi:hypothetical protein
MIYQLDRRQSSLTWLCVRWQNAVRGVPAEHCSGESWGPPEGELSDAAREIFTGSWDEAAGTLEASTSDSEASLCEEIGDGEDLGDLFETFGSIAFTDAYREQDDAVDSESASPSRLQTDGFPPLKRARVV